MWGDKNILAYANSESLGELDYICDVAFRSQKQC